MIVIYDMDVNTYRGPNLNAHVLITVKEIVLKAENLCDDGLPASVRMWVSKSWSE